MLFNFAQVSTRLLNIQDSHSIYREFKISKNIFYKNGVIVIGALWENEIIGIISIYNNQPYHSIISELQVTPIFRRHGVASLLLRSAEQICKQNKSSIMRGIIDDESPYFQTIKKILKNQEWNELGIDHNYYRIKKCDINKTFIGRHSVMLNPDIDSDIQIKTISQIDSKERLSMEEYLNNIPDCLKPMSFSRNMIEDLTLFIIRHKKTIGWLTVTLPNKEEFCIENIYILKEYRNKCYGITLLGVLKDKLQHYNNKDFKYISYFTDNEDIINKSMHNMLGGEYVDKQINYYVFEKLI